jgi:hypothetical protein
MNGITGTKTLVLMITLGIAMAVSATEPSNAENSAAAVAAAYSAYASPGNHHEALAERVGNWDVKVTTWLAPGAAPEVSTGKSEITMIMGGRYLLENFSGEFDGRSFAGMGLTGYDNLKQRYVATWIDTMSTGIMAAESTSIGEDSVEYRGEGPDPLTGSYISVRSSEHRINADTYRFETYVTDPDGEEFKNMELFYTRK